MRQMSLLLALFLFSAVACDGGCGKKEAKIPETPVERVEQMASHLPTNTELAVFVGDIDASRKSLNTLKDKLGQQGLVDTVKTQFRNDFGIDPLSEESWKNAGVAPKSGFTVGYVRSRVVFMTYVENRQKFEKVLTEKTKKAFGIEAVVKSEKQGKIDMKVLSQDPARQIAWLYKGKLAIVVLPATSGQGALMEGSARQVLATASETTKETGIPSTAGWADFTKRLAKNYPITAYLNSQAYLARDEVKKEIAEDPTLATSADWANKNVKYVGAGFRVEGAEARLDVFGATSKEFVESAKKVQTVAKAYDWTGFATEHTLLGLRVSVDPKAGWKLAMDNLPEDERRGIQRRLQIMGEQYALDIEKDVINKLSGNIGLFFYGVAGNPLQLMQADPGLIASKAGLLIAIPFDSAESLNAVVQKVMGPLGQMITSRPAKIDGEDDPTMTVIELTMPTAPGRFYVSGENLIFATTAFGDSAIKKYLDKQRPEKSLAEVDDLNLGKEFTKEANFNGIYFNSKRAMDNLGTVIAFSGLGEVLAQTEEAALTFGVEDGGLAASLRVDLNEAAPAAGGQKDGQDNQQKPDESGQ